MKKILFLVIAFIMLLSFQAWAKDVTVIWDASPEEDIDHYIVWAAPWLGATHTGPFEQKGSVGSDVTEFTIQDLEDGVYYVFVVYAVNMHGRFSYASNVATDEPTHNPAPLQNVRVTKTEN